MAFSLSDYADMRELGRGGFARIFLAVQKSLDRKVVIKQLERSGDPGLRKRFEKEARAAAALEHPNIVRIYDFGVHDNACCIVMEYVDGCDLEALLRAPDIPVEIGLAAALQALHGLRFSHSNGIVHRDVKPANILVARSGVAKIADFGLALAEFERQGLTQSDLTRSGTMAGTPHYMSPEQAGNGPIKDRRIDIWAAGALCYRILTGKLPFDGDSLPALVYNIVHVRETPIWRLLPRLPEHLAANITRCLEKDPEKRPDSLHPLIESLTDYLSSRGMVDAATYICRCPAVARAQRQKPSLFEGAQEQEPAPTQDSKQPVHKPAQRRNQPARAAVFAALAIGVCAVAVLVWLFLKPKAAAVRITVSQDNAAAAAPLAQPVIAAPPGRALEAIPKSKRQSASKAPQQQASSLRHEPAPRSETAPVATHAADTVQSEPPFSMPAIAPVTDQPVPPAAPSGMGELLILTYPLDAKIYIDGAFIARNSADAPVALAAGKRTLTVQKEGYRDDRRELTIRPGTLTRVKIRLEK